MQDHTQRPQHTHALAALVASLALLLAICAIALAWMAYNRSGTNVPTDIEAQYNTAAQEARQQWLEAKWNTQLAWVQFRLLVQEETTDLADEVADIRNDIVMAQNDAQVEIRQEWRDIERDLGQVEIQIRANSADAIGTLEQVLDDLETVIRADSM